VFGADRGRSVVRGRTACLLSFGIGFNPNLSGHENIYLNGSLLGMSKRTIDERIDRIIDFSELGQFIRAPVRTYSAGMRARLGFSIAIETDPDVLLLDEALGAGDEAFRAKAGTTLERLRGDNKTVVLANHNLTLISRSCTRVAWIDAGKIRMIGNPAEVVDAYRTCMNPRKEAAASVVG
jgi:ABC-type polysaccharide/polyol phosphate transport system ATPase subunit